jgi:hypothetical protein
MTMTSTVRADALTEHEHDLVLRLCVMPFFSFFAFLAFFAREFFFRDLTAKEKAAKKYSSQLVI